VDDQTIARKKRRTGHPRTGYGRPETVQALAAPNNYTPWKKRRGDGGKNSHCSAAEPKMRQTNMWRAGHVA
jgi:phosphatidate phosphatase APP1